MGCGHPTGNQYVAAMASERAWHSSRKSDPEYNRREDQLAREFGKRRAAHDKASNGRGHDYQHSPPLFTADGVGTAVQPQKRKPRRKPEQIAKENQEQKEKEDRLRALFDAGDTTFTTLGVIDMNVSVEESQRGRKKRGRKKKTGKGVGKGDDKGDEVKKKGRGKAKAGQENSPQPHPGPPTPKKRRSLSRQQATPAVVMDVEMTSTATVAVISQDSKATAVRAIVFR